jgi:hypothetical protein
MMIFRSAIILALYMTRICAASPPGQPDPQPLPDLAPCDQVTPYGRPSLAVARPVTLLCRKAYISAHDNQRLAYDWVAWTETHDRALGLRRAA